MDFNEMAQNIIDLAGGNPVVAAAGAFVVLFLLFRKPKLLLVLVLFTLAAKGVMLLFDKLSGTGLDKIIE